jgi:hypothetical protein
MVIYKGGKSQFDLYKAAEAQEPDMNEANALGQVIAKEKKWSNIHLLDQAYKEEGEETPIGGDGIAKGLRKENEK